MSNAFSLEDEGGNWKYIYKGNEWIGRVCQHADGSYIGLIGKYITVKGCRTEKEAFNEAVAQYLRYSNTSKKNHHKKQKSKPVQIQTRSPAIIVRPEVFTATKAFMRPGLSA